MRRVYKENQKNMHERSCRLHFKMKYLCLISFILCHYPHSFHYLTDPEKILLIRISSDFFFSCHSFKQYMFNQKQRLILFQTCVVVFWLPEEAWIKPLSHIIKYFICFEVSIIIVTSEIHSEEWICSKATLSCVPSLSVNF